MTPLRHALAAMVGFALLAGCMVPSEPTTAQAEAALASAHDGTPPQTPHPPALLPGAFGFTTLDVGQGDAAVVVAPGGCAAILDAGPVGSGATIKTYLRSAGIARVDFAVLSHYHADHLGGLDEVEQGADAIPIARVYDHGGSYSSSAFNAYEDQFRNRRVTAQQGQTISLCGQVTFQVMASNANGGATSDENARSVVVKISYGDLDVLVGGDLPSSAPDVESSIGTDIGEVEVYKVHHHGSAGASSARFLDRIRPTVSFISAAAHNSYGHPAPSTLLRLDDVGSAVFQTATVGAADERGHLELTSTTGSDFSVTQRGQSTHYASKH